MSRWFYLISACVGLMTIGYERYRQIKMVPPVRGLINTYQFLTWVMFTVFFTFYYTLQAVKTRARNTFYWCVLYSSILVTFGYVFLMILGLIMGFKVHFQRNLDLILMEISTHVFNLIIPLIEYRFIMKHKSNVKAIFYVGVVIFLKLLYSLYTIQANN